MLKEYIDKFYSGSEKGDKERDYFYVSEVGKCPRQVYFAVKQAPKKPLEPRVLRLLDVGNYTHLRLSGVLVSMGLLRASEIEIPKNELIHGRADAVVSIDNELYVVDFKSINSTALKNMRQPKPEHVKQIQLYMYFFKIQRGIILYECKDQSEIVEFQVGSDENLAKSLISGFEELLKKIKVNQVPEIPDDLEIWQCSYCAYVDECKKI